MANRFIKIAGGFYRDTPQGLSAVNDPQSLRQLSSGELTAEEGTTGNFSSQVATPSFVPTSANIASSLPSGQASTSTIQPVSDDPYDNFNLLLLDALKKAQGVGTADLLKKKRDLERASLGKASEITPEGLRTLSPTQQETIRTGQVSALRPDIDETAYQIEKANQQIANFEKVYLEASKLGEEFQKSMVAPDSVVQSYKQAIEADPDRLSVLLSGLNDKTRNAVIGSLDYDKLKPTEDTSLSSMPNSYKEWSLAGGETGTGKTYAEYLGGGTAVVPPDVTDPFIISLYETQGGKPLTDTTIQKLDKGLTVLGQLGVLQGNIQDVKTGPIVGAFKSNNPWDTEGQTIKAQLNAIVPNLARGVFGEVGVLTDNDIKTYSQTLPNLSLTEEVRNAVLYITLDMIGKSIKNTLSVNAAAGRDVSGFVDIYTEMQKTKDSILSTIPGAVVQGQEVGTEDIDFTIEQNRNTYGTREQLIEAIVNATGINRDTVASRVYALIPNR